MTPQRDCDLRVNEGTALDNFILTIFKFPIAGPISWILGPNCGDQSDSAPAPRPLPVPLLRIHGPISRNENAGKVRRNARKPLLECGKKCG